MQVQAINIQNNQTSFGAIKYQNGLLGVLFTAAIGVVGYAVKKDVDSVNGKPNTTIVAKDTLKTDSIKPILEDSFKLGKKIIKK